MVTVKLDRERHLRLTLRGMMSYEEVMGKSLLTGFDLKAMSLKEVSGFIWACLIHEDRELTYEAFVDMVDLSNLSGLIDAVSACITESFPEKEKRKGSPLVKSRG